MDCASTPCRSSFQAKSRATESLIAAIFDVEGKALGQAGSALGQHLNQYRAPVRIESDIAGQVVITTSSDTADAAHRRLVLSLLGLAVLLSLAVYGTTRHLGQRLGNRIAAAASRSSLAPASSGVATSSSSLPDASALSRMSWSA